MEPRVHLLPPIVVTRPIAQARLTQQKIEASGRQAVLFPLLEINALDDTTALDAALAKLSEYSLVAFVSPNAIDAAFRRRQPWPDEVPLAVMGEGSRQALAAHGITAATTQIYSPADIERTDSQTLLEVLDATAYAGRNVLIVRGEGGRELLADALRATGAVVTQVAAYRRSAPVIDADCLGKLRGLLSQQCLWIITSSEALRVLVSMAECLDREEDRVDDTGPMGKLSWVAILQRQDLVVPHVRIAETAALLGFSRVSRSASGDTGLFAALQSRHE